MSIFSGKCDLYDHYLMICVDDNTTEDEINERISKSTFHIRTKDNKKHRLDIHNIHDLIPYYPYLISIGGFSKEEGDNITLSSESFVDYEERQMLDIYLYDILKYARKCKREKKELTKEDILKHIWISDNSLSDKITTIALEKGVKATLKDLYDANIHTRIAEYYRNKLYETMVSSGYSEIESYYWCFGDLVFNKEQMKRLRKDVF